MSSDLAICTATILRIADTDAIIDVGNGREGVVSLQEWSDTERLPQPGQTIEVALHGYEDESGLLYASRRLAERVGNFEAVTADLREGQAVTCNIVRQIPGGWLAAINGVGGFLPASQVKADAADDFVVREGTDVECAVLKVDSGRLNLILSRRRLLENDHG